MHRAQMQVAEFHRSIGHPVNNTPTTKLPKKIKKLRARLIREECQELRDALLNDDIVGTADAIADLLYVVLGAAVECGIPAEWVFEEVHRSNMTKVGPDGKVYRRADGKATKGPNFRPPDILPLLEEWASSPRYEMASGE